MNWNDKTGNIMSISLTTAPRYVGRAGGVSKYIKLNVYGSCTERCFKSSSDIDKLLSVKGWWREL